MTYAEINSPTFLLPDDAFDFIHATVGCAGLADEAAKEAEEEERDAKAKGVRK